MKKNQWPYACGWVDLPTAAALTGLSRRYIRELVSSKKLNALQGGADPIIHVARLAEYEATKEKMGRPPTTPRKLPPCWKPACAGPRGQAYCRAVAAQLATPEGEKEEGA
jgi:hypothetical protein